jgi:hypothetical protein
MLEQNLQGELHSSQRQIIPSSDVFDIAPIETSEEVIKAFISTLPSKQQRIFVLLLENINRIVDTALFLQPESDPLAAAESVLRYQINKIRISLSSNPFMNHRYKILNYRSSGYKLVDNDTPVDPFESFLNGTQEKIFFGLLCQVKNTFVPREVFLQYLYENIPKDPADNALRAMCKNINRRLAKLGTKVSIDVIRGSGIRVLDPNNEIPQATLDIYHHYLVKYQLEQLQLAPAPLQNGKAGKK